MKKSLIIIGIVSALLGAIFMKFSKLIFFTGMVIYFVLSLTTQVSANQSPDANKYTEKQQKRLFISAMSYVIAGIIALFF